MAKPKPKKEPVVRRGNYKPYVKGTNVEIEKRIEETAFLLARGASKTQIHETIGRKHNLHWRTIDDIYIVRARKLLLEKSNKTRDEARGDAVSFYESVLLSATSTTKEKIQARSRLDEIFGIDAPRRTELSGPGGEPIELDSINSGLDKEHLDTLLREHFNHNGATNGHGHADRAGKS